MNLQTSQLRLPGLALIRVCLGVFVVCVAQRLTHNQVVVPILIQLLGIALMIGLKTRRVTVVLAVILSATYLFSARGMATPFDYKPILAVFWASIFLPLGAGFSIDRLFLTPDVRERLTSPDVPSDSNFPLKIYYDGDCSICFHLVGVIQETLKVPNSAVFKAQSNPEIFSKMERENSWVLFDMRTHRYFFQWDAVIVLLSLSQNSAIRCVSKIAACRPVASISNLAYKSFANHRSFYSLFIPETRSLASIEYGNTWLEKIAALVLGLTFLLI